MLIPNSNNWPTYGSTKALQEQGSSRNKSPPGIKACIVCNIHCLYHPSKKDILLSGHQTALQAIYLLRTTTEHVVPASGSQALQESTVNCMRWQKFVAFLHASTEHVSSAGGQSSLQKIMAKLLVLAFVLIFYKQTLSVEQMLAGDGSNSVCSGCN